MCKMENGQKKGNTKNEKETKMRNKQIITKKKKRHKLDLKGRGGKHTKRDRSKFEAR